MRAQKIFALIALIVSATSCSDGGENQRAPGSNYFSNLEANPAATPTPAPGPTDSIDAAALAREKAVDKLAVIAYKQDLEPMIKNYCLSCHGSATATGKLDLSSYDAVSKVASKMSQAIRSKKMPPKAADLASEVRKKVDRLGELLDAWDDRPSELAEDLATFNDLTYKDTVGPLLTEVCAKCHGGDAPKANIKLTNEAEIEARLDKAIEVIQSGKMPPKLDQARRDQLGRILESWREKDKP